MPYRPRLRVEAPSPNVIVQRRRPGAGQGRRWSPAAARGTSRCTAASSGPACSTPRARARCSRRRCRTRCWPRPKAVDGGAGVAAHRQELHGRRDELRARRRGRAEDEGIEVESVRDERRRRRAGLALHRGPARRRRDRAGREDRRRARPRRGDDLADGGARSRGKVNERARSYRRRAARRASLPAAGTPTFDLGDGEMEVGIGIHGEPGAARRSSRRVDDMAEMARRRRSSATSATSGDAACSRSSTAWAGRR